ncbi:MAG: GDSL-type esterase/lipase family protein [Geminicoccaceae bacterium]
MKRLAAAALLPVISLVVALALVEAGLRLTDRVRNVGPSFTEFDPVYGKWLKKNASIRRITPEFDMLLETDSLGFREPELPDDAKGAILFTGDSFTMGYGVDQNLDFPSLVRAALEREMGAEAPAIVNTGVGNSGNGRTLLWLEREAARFDPSLVVIQLTSNDFEDNREERLFEPDHSGTLRPLPVHPPGLARRIQAAIDDTPWIANLHLVGFAREVVIALRQRRESSTDERVDPDGGDELTFAILRRILAVCGERNWPVLGLAVEIGAGRLARLEKLFEEARSELLVMPTKQERPDLYYDRDGHWREQGHAFASSMLLDRMNRQQKN